MIEAAGVIERCPQCDYLLRGLPDEHRCPECGLVNERDTILFREPRTVWAVAGVVYMSLAVMAGVLWSSGRTPAFGLWVPIGLAVIAWIWFWNLRKAMHFILVSRRNIRILGRNEEAEVYPISDVGGDQMGFRHGRHPD